MSNLQYFPLRQVRPAGWLQDFLQRQATGLTGNVAVSGYPYGYKFWGTRDDNTKGSYAAWWPYEQTAYWIDGALKCGYLAGDDELYRQALEEVDFAVEHAAEDGFIGPDSLRDKDRWPHAVFFRAVLAQYEITGDRRYLDALIRHYRSTPHPLGWDRDVTGVEILLYLYHASGEPDLLEKAESLYARFNEKWPGHDCTQARIVSRRLMRGLAFKTSTARSRMDRMRNRSAKKIQVKKPPNRTCSGSRKRSGRRTGGTIISKNAPTSARAANKTAITSVGWLVKNPTACFSTCFCQGLKLTSKRSMAPMLINKSPSQVMPRKTRAADNPKINWSPGFERGIRNRIKETTPMMKLAPSRNAAICFFCAWNFLKKIDIFSRYRTGTSPVPTQPGGDKLRPYQSLFDS